MSIPPSIKPHFPQKQPVIIQNVSPHLHLPMTPGVIRKEKGLVLDGGEKGGPRALLSWEWSLAIVGPSEVAMGSLP